MRRISNNFIALFAILLMVLSLVMNIFVVDLTQQNMKATGAPVGDVGVFIVGCGDGVCNATESCSSCSTDCGVCPVAAPVAVGGGGGAPATLRVSDFTIEPDFLKVSLKQGETVTKTVTVTNTGDIPLDFTLDLGSLKDFILVSEKSFHLEPRESKTLTLDFSARIDEIPDVYADTLTFTAGGISKSLRVIFEVESRKALFDVLVRIPIEYKQVHPGENVVGNITLTNMGDLMPVDALVNYTLRDFSGKIFLEEQETLALTKQLNYLKSLPLPSTIPEGTYVYAVKVTSDDSTALSSDTFEVLLKIEKPKAWTTTTFWLWWIILLLILLNLWFWMRKKKKSPSTLLKEEISQLLKKKYSRKRTLKLLVKKGWKKTFVQRVLKEFK